MGSGVVVVGMHRSGTSAVTRAISLLGVPTCVPGDLVRDRTGNLRGHWESASLVRFNDRLLASVSASWWCPPPAQTDWQVVADERRGAALSALATVHPTESWVWKDPRTCLTLPFWREVLPDTPAFVLVVRHPLSIAASLRRRSGITLQAGVALWEGYLARAVPAMAGAPVIVCGYRDVLRDPLRWSWTAHDFLADQRVPLGTAGDPDVAAASLDASLAHDSHAEEDVGRCVLTDNQVALLSGLERLYGVHERFEPADVGLVPVTPATELFFAEQRTRIASSSVMAAPAAANRSGIQLQVTPPVRHTSLPSISVVIAARDGQSSLDDTLAGVLSTIPAAAEIVVVGGQALGPERTDARVVIVERPAGAGRAAAIMAGTERTTGEVVVVCDAGVVPHAGWPDALCGALERSDAGAVAPALLQGGGAVYGLTLRDVCLNAAWIYEPPSEVPFPVPSLCGAMLALRREVLEAVGGFDRGMSGHGAEDVELCVRLWRAGYLCLSVPRASAAASLSPQAEGSIEPVAFLHNRLRLGAVHLSQPTLRRFLDAFVRHAAFPEAFARVLASDVGERRAFVNGLSCFDDAWFFARFGIEWAEPVDKETVYA